MQRGDSVLNSRVSRAAARGDRQPGVWDATHQLAYLAELPEERPIVVEINGHPVGRLLATPEDLAPLAAGWAYSHGFVRTAQELRTVTTRGERVSVMLDAPGPGGKTWEALLAAGFDARHTRARGVVTAELTPLPAVGDPHAVYLDRDDLFLTVERLFEHFKRQRGGGGYHFAGGASVDGIGRIVRDISRHNAIDKLVGFALLERTEPMPVMAALSGRISADIVFKAWRAGIPVLVTRSLPTAEAVALAEYAGVTLIGRALGQKRSIFSHVWRFGAVTAM